MKKKILLVGLDSRLGKVFYHQYHKQFNIFGTSKKNIKKKNIFYLNLKNIKNFNYNLFFDYVVILSGVVDYNDCEKNYRAAKLINCLNIPKLILKFLKKNSRIIFVSSNTVFKRKNTLASEYSKTNPDFNYAKLKDISEKRILSYKKYFKDKISIVRISKNVDIRRYPFNYWIKNIKKNKPFLALNDLYFAPILYENTAYLLKKIIDKNYSGVFHLSGVKDLTYSDFAKNFLQFLGTKRNLVKSVSSKDLDIKLIYNHPVTALRMNRTTLYTGIKPVNSKEIFKYLYKFI
jgi:dTDP-4-dehydrorhamnose reductase